MVQKWEAILLTANVGSVSPGFPLVNAWKKSYQMSPCAKRWSAGCQQQSLFAISVVVAVSASWWRWCFAISAIYQQAIEIQLLFQGPGRHWPVPAWLAVELTFADHNTKSWHLDPFLLYYVCFWEKIHAYSFWWAIGNSNSFLVPSNPSFWKYFPKIFYPSNYTIEYQRFGVYWCFHRIVKQ